MTVHVLNEIYSILATSGRFNQQLPVGREAG